MNSQNSLSHIILAYKKTSFAFIFFISFTLLSFKTQNVEALFIPTLSASVDQSAVSVNGNQVINSTGKTTEIPLSITVNTNNKTGYTATLNSETNETALVNNNSTNGAKINSVSTNLSLNNLPNNSWGYKFGSSTNYAPIPALSTPAQILQTTEKTNGNESNQLSIGMKLSDNLESGRYTNKLIFSILTNNYNRIAIMTEGPDFNTKLKALETATNKIEHFKKSTVSPTASMNVVNIEDEDSDCEIKLWLDPADKTAYYYAEPEKVYLNTDSNAMFYSEYGGQKIKSILDIDLSSFDTTKVTNASHMFDGVSSLTTLNLSNFNTSKVMNMGYMFSGMRNLTTLNLSGFDTSRVTNMSHMFNGMYNLITLNLSNFDTSQVTDMGGMFNSMNSLITLNLSNFDTSQATNMNGMFASMSSLTTLNLSNFNTSQVTDMGGMFSGMSGLTTLDLSSFDTSKVMNMGYMFSGMRNLTTLNLSSFDTSKVTNMDGMFAFMSSLTTLNLSNFNTSQVTRMYRMFSGMRNLTTLNLSSFDTSKVTRMYYMFSDMSSLTTLNLSNFNTFQVTDMSGMFSNMSSLTTLDLSNIDTSNVKDMSYMFYLDNEDELADRLEKIYVNNDFNTAKLTNVSEMFKNRKKLRGGNGSYLANPSTADKSWLRVDRPGAQGYFTKKP